MKRLRRTLAALILGILAFLPLPGCTAGQAAGMGAVMQLALGVGASVGSYFLIRELD
jgi:hypothetical protein